MTGLEAKVELEPLTPRQAEIVIFIAERFAASLTWPSIREMMARFNYVSTNAMQSHFKPLCKKGWLEREADQSRGVRLAGIVAAARQGINPVAYANEMVVKAKRSGGLR